MPPATSICATPTKATLPVRERQEVMGLLGAKGGPRNWQVAGNVSGSARPGGKFCPDTFSPRRSALRGFLVMKPEDLLVERVLMTFYPAKVRRRVKCAKKLVAVVLGGALNVNWDRSPAACESPEYRNLPQCKCNW